MGAVIRSVAAGLLRYVLAGVIGWLISKGIATPEQVEILIAGLSGAIVLAATLVWVKYRDRVRFLTALRQPTGATEDDVQRAIDRGRGVKPTDLTMLALVVGLGLASAGCATGRGLVATAPTPEQTQAVRRDAIRATVSVTAALGILDETGRLVDQLPLSVAAKDRYDCAILAVTGSPTPVSVTVQRVCGAVPLQDVAPLTLALESLREVSTCPSLRATLSSVYGWTAPLITQLSGAEHPALQMAGASLRIALSLLTAGGATCSL